MVMSTQSILQKRRLVLISMKRPGKPLRLLWRSSNRVGRQTTVSFLSQWTSWIFLNEFHDETSCHSQPLVSFESTNNRHLINKNTIVKNRHIVNKHHRLVTNTVVFNVVKIIHFLVLNPFQIGPNMLIFRTNSSCGTPVTLATLQERLWPQMIHNSYTNIPIVV